MCLILDANKYSDFLNHKNTDMIPIRNWLNGKGRIAYSPTKKFENELNSREIKEQFAEYRDAGKMKLVDKEQVQEAQNQLSGLQSDDPHIIALAKVANVRLLVSADKKLHEDFKTIIRGSIYQNSSHAGLLTKHLCP